MSIPNNNEPNKNTNTNSNPFTLDGGLFGSKPTTGQTGGTGSFSGFGNTGNQPQGTNPSNSGSNPSTNPFGGVNTTQTNVNNSNEQSGRTFSFNNQQTSNVSSNPTEVNNSSNTSDKPSGSIIGIGNSNPNKPAEYPFGNKSTDPTKPNDSKTTLFGGLNSLITNPSTTQQKVDNHVQNTEKPTLFGLGSATGNNLFGQSNVSEENKQKENKEAFGLGGNKPIENKLTFNMSEKTGTSAISGGLFGAQTTSTTSTTTQPTEQSKPTFGLNLGTSSTNITSNTTQPTEQSKPSIGFGASFSNTTSTTTKPTEQTKPSLGSNFGAQSTDPSKLNTTFGATTTSTDQSKPSSGSLFGASSSTTTNITGGLFNKSDKKEEPTTKPTGIPGLTTSGITSNPTNDLTKTFGAKPTDPIQDKAKPTTFGGPSIPSSSNPPEGKPDGKNLGKNNFLNLVKTTIKPVPEEKQLDEVSLNAMMNKSIEDVINKWKSNLDSQVDEMQNSTEKLKNFELMFLKNFDNICSLYDLIGTLTDESNNTIKTLDDISNEEDSIIEQLTIMNKQLDLYLDVAEKNYRGNNVGDNKNYIYDAAMEISKVVSEVQKDIDEVNNKIGEPLHESKEESMKLTQITYENQLQKEKVQIDKNEFTNILNSYYNSLRSIQYMEQGLSSKLAQVESEINERRKI